MTQTVTLELPAELVDRARCVAERTRRRFEDVLIEWMSRAESVSVEELSDEEVLALCDSQLPESDQEQLSELLGRQREGQLQPGDKQRLEQLLGAYRRGLLRKAQALQVAVSRGLRAPLG
jgi:hypothetical protein